MLNVLVAFPYWGALVTEQLKTLDRSEYRLIVDSGAFSAWNRGAKIELDDYCRFLDSISQFRPFYAVQLDVFGDPEASFRNLMVMRERGYDVMPVHTRGDSVEMLNRYYEMTDYIMFGGIVVGSENRGYVKWWLQQNQGRKAHWLGFVDVPFIKVYRPESADSTSWMTANIYGLLRL